MYYAVHGKTWFAVRTTDEDGIEFPAETMSLARSFAASLNSIGGMAGLMHTPGTFSAIPVEHRYFIYLSPLQIRDSFALEELAAYPESRTDDVLAACVGLNSGLYVKSEFTWTHCARIGASTASENDCDEGARRIPKIHLSFVRSGYVWSNHGTVWFWAEKEPEWTGSAYESKKKSQFNLPWIQYKKTWAGAYESLAKVEK